MRVVVVVQARVRSSRLPAKVLLDLGGKTALERCVVRARAIAGVDDVVVATPDGAADDPVARLAKRLGCAVTRGSEIDVLDRFAQAAREHRAEVVMRVTSDCPLLDPVESGRVLSAFLASEADYASNVISRRLPRGLDTEVFGRDALEEADRSAVSSDEREHVTLHIYRRPDRFRLLEVVPPKGVDLSSKRWTLDTLEDYCFLHALFEHLGERAHSSSIDDIVALLGRYPELEALNAAVTQKVV